MWDARDSGKLFAYVTASALTDIFYICRKHAGRDKAMHAVEACLRGFTVMAVDHDILAAALSFSGADFEDNVQIASAVSSNLDLIVTRNPEDFASSPVPAVNPGQVPEYFGRQPR
jgi:hypothetical protein